jgi:hypothetical protein
MFHRQTAWSFRFRSGVGLAYLAVLFGLAACAHEQQPPPASSPPSSTPPAEIAGAEPASATVPQSEASASVFVVHQVSDVEGFKKYFEEGAAQRATSGVLGYLMTRLDDGRFVVHFVAKDVQTVEQALKSDAMQQRLNRGSAPDASLVWVTRDELLKVPSEQPKGKTYSLFLKVHVSDFDALKKGFEERYPRFEREGIIGQGLHRSTARDDVAILHFVATDRTKLEALPKHPEFVDLLTKAGNRELAKPLVGEDVARSR